MSTQRPNQALQRTARSRYHWQFYITGSPSLYWVVKPFMRACTFITILLALFVTVSGCSRGPKLTSKVQAMGGAAALQTECAGFIRIFEESKEQSYAWMPRDTNFPPAIASLSPQVVSVTRQDGVLLVDVRVTGGFIHHGLLVAPSPTPAGFKPQMSSWPVWQITNGVWEYRE